MKRYLFLLLILLLAVPSHAEDRLAWGGSMMMVGGAAAGCSGTATYSEMNTTGGSQAFGLATTSAWIATKFVASESATVCSAVMRLSTASSPTFNITVHVFTDNGSGTPLAEVGTGSGPIAASTLTGSEASYTFTGMSCALTSGTTYWVVMKASSTDSTNTAKWHYTSSGVTESLWRANPWASIAETVSGKFTLNK